MARVAEFQFVKISVVREYLYLEFKDLQLPFKFDFERLVDDFVFLCFSPSVSCTLGFVAFAPFVSYFVCLYI